MQVTLEQIILSDTGAQGRDFLQHVFARQAGFVMPFVNKYPQLAADWVAVSPHKRQQSATDEIIVDLLGEQGVRDMEKDTCLPRESIVRIADALLYKAVQIASPSGLRVSNYAANRLDKNLAALFASPR